MAENIQAYTSRIMQHYDTNRNGLVELNPMPFLSDGQEAAAMSPKLRQFFEMSRSSYPILHAYAADQVSISRTVAAAVDTNHNGQVGIFERVKAYFNFGLW